jgi:small conductance mechanosensitive channel
MDLNALVGGLLNNDRLLANLVGIHVILGALLLASVLVRKTFKHGGRQFVRWTHLHWLEGLNREAHRSLRGLLFWVTLGLMAASIVSMGVYHASGRDLRVDLQDWYTHLTGVQILAVGVLLGKLVLVAVLTAVAFRLIRRASAFFEAYVQHHLPRHIPAPAGGLRPELPVREYRVSYEETVKRWFFLLERFAMAAVVLAAVWVAGRLAEWQQLDAFAGLLLRILTIVTVARLLTLSCRTISYAVATLGDGYLGRGKFRRYWDRVTRLIPFGERCFEAAVYILAASMCVRELDFIAFVASYGTKIVKCIGIFFGTRVVIELLYVFLNEAFGLYEEDRPIDQKGLTLVPLLQSLCQYTLYFGSVLFMLGVFEIETTPILAGAGILGLAGGLGAQSLVTDVVSGFFILFENWYLVGDVVQIGDAAGRIEVVSIRHTQIRDDQGKLIIIPNGQIKTVTNFSKGYVNAVVDIKVPTSANLDRVMHDMAEAGRRLRRARAEVLGETAIKGLVELTPGDMVIRAVTKVQPGTHQAIQLEYRRLLKEVFDEAHQPSPQEAVAA